MRSTDWWSNDWLIDWLHSFSIQKIIMKFLRFELYRGWSILGRSNEIGTDRCNEATKVWCMSIFFHVIYCIFISLANADEAAILYSKPITTNWLRPNVKLSSSLGSILVPRSMIHFDTVIGGSTERGSLVQGRLMRNRWSSEWDIVFDGSLRVK